MPAPKGFESQGDEIDALSLAVVCCSSHFPVEGKVETVSRGDGGLCHSGLLQRVDNGDFQSSIATSRPVGEQNICGAPIVAGEEKAPLLLWVEHSTRSHLENMVSKVIVSGNALAPEPATKGMVTKLVAWVVASRAWPILTIHLATEAVFHSKNKLYGLEVQAQGW